MTKTYATKQILVDVLEWSGDNVGELYQFIPSHLRSEEPDGVTVATKQQNNRLINAGDFIVKYDSGEFDVFIAEDFNNKFEPMPEPEEETHE